MSDGFNADPEQLRTMGDTVRASVGPMLSAAAALPSAEAGLMTPVIEAAMLRLLEATQGLGSEAAGLGDRVLEAAVTYLREDEHQRAELDHLMTGLSYEESAAYIAADNDARWIELLATYPSQTERAMDLLSTPPPPSSGGPPLLLPEPGVQAPPPAPSGSTPPELQELIDLLAPGTSQSDLQDLLLDPLALGEVERGD